jgi:F420H(2)-dependent quinone reductase
MELSGEYIPSSNEWVRDQVAAYEASNGQEANVLPGTEWTVVVVTMRGASSGAVRKIGLMRVEHDGDYGLIASKGGAPEHPSWYFNLLAHPDEVLIQDGAVKKAYVVEEVFGTERDEWWHRGVAAYPPYEEYQANTDRIIPVLVARPR